VAARQRQSGTITLKLRTRFGLPAQLKFAAIGGKADIRRSRWLL
jgi:hypothetical protein